MAYCLNVCGSEDPEAQKGKKYGADAIDDEFSEFIEEQRAQRSKMSKACIFKVPEWLRKTNPEAFTPTRISIGPYHKTLEDTEKTKAQRDRYLVSFLKNTQKSKEEAREEMKKLSETAKACYKDYPKDLEDDKFVNMLLYDGIFVVEFLRQNINYLEVDDNMVAETYRDLLLIENQLPFFVLQMLDQMLTTKTVASLQRVIKLSFSTFVPKLTPHNIVDVDNDPQGIKHLLQVVHSLCIPRCDQDKDSLKGWTKKGKVLKKATDLQNDRVCFEGVGCVLTELEYNCEFLKRKTTMFDIKFDMKLRKAIILSYNGFRALQIPCFKVDDNTETFFQNMIAYEQCSPPGSHNLKFKYYKDFACFMYLLLGCEEDANLLRRNGIIVNLIGDDKKVCEMFSKLVTSSLSTNFYFANVCNQAKLHCDSVKLLRDYLKALAVLSMLLGVFLAYFNLAKLLPKDL
nr:UPF0481 protein At3g47200-like [Ipomoea batatas]